MDMSLTIYPFLVSTYARNIYLYGTNRLTARDGYPGVRTGYYTPVEQYAANIVANNGTITNDDIDNALAQGWINQQEYDETIGYMS